jgi:NAD(P)-dependent dehydrogenase (short-subunit alcohol dehydrogenase family)
VKRLNGVVAVVTGGNGGIGEATCRRLALEGACLGIGYLEEKKKAVALAEELSAAGQKCIAVYGDVCDQTSVNTMMEAVRSALGPITVLVNNAGIARHTPFMNITESEWTEVINTNLSGAFRCIKSVLDDMLAAGHGCVVNISSELALTGGDERAHYVASKSGIIGLTMSLAREFGPRNIRVNAIAPGPTDTRMLGETGRAEKYVQGLPLRRIGRPDEIAAAVAFMCSPDAGYCTGQVLSPNGGAVI